MGGVCGGCWWVMFVCGVCRLSLWVEFVSGVSVWGLHSVITLPSSIKHSNMYLYTSLNTHAHY